MTSSILETFTKPREKNASEHRLASARLSKPTNFEMDAFTKKLKPRKDKVCNNTAQLLFCNIPYIVIILVVVTISPGVARC